jgi:hypothetical protein
MAWLYAYSCLQKHKKNLMYASKLSRMDHTHNFKETPHQNCQPVKLLKTGTPSNWLLDHEEYGKILADLKDQNVAA